MNVRTLRFKLGVTNGLFISVFFVFFGYVRYQTFAYRAERIFERGMENQANFFTKNIQASPDGTFEWKNDVPSADVLSLDTIRPFFVLTDLNGRVMHPESYGSYIQQMLKEKDLYEVVHHQAGFSDAEAYDGAKFRFLNRVIPSENGRIVVLHLGRRLNDLRDVLGEYMRVYLWSIPFILVVAGGVGWFLAVHALNPFAKVAKTAEEITSENLNMRIEDAGKEQEIQSLVQSFNAMVARLRESFDQMRRFNANVAHELRTPLAILQGENEIALRSIAGPEELRSILISNLEELGRLTRIVNDILTLSEAEAGTQVLHKKPIQLNVLVSDLSDQMQFLAMERNVQIEVQKLPDAVVEADDLWMRRAILNLLDNAIKYSRDGGRIYVSMTVGLGKVRVSIRDEGIGIRAHDLPHIFDRLFRADPARSRDTGGSGLGLALVKWAIEAHDGRVHVDSEPEKGADFQIELPLLPPGSKEMNLKAHRTPTQTL